MGWPERPLQHKIQLIFGEQDDDINEIIRTPFSIMIIDPLHDATCLLDGISISQINEFVNETHWKLVQP